MNQMTANYVLLRELKRNHMVTDLISVLYWTKYDVTMKNFRKIYILHHYLRINHKLCFNHAQNYSKLCPLARVEKKAYCYGPFFRTVLDET